jgi:hypothetical protein
VEFIRVVLGWVAQKAVSVDLDKSGDFFDHFDSV